jgi:hypothetical protein
MKMQLAKHQLNYQLEFERGATQQQLDEIEAKISYYYTAVVALKYLYL